MRNSFQTTLNVSRQDICDLLLACLAAEDASNGGKKWYRLYDHLKEQLKNLDAQLDTIQDR